MTGYKVILYRCNHSFIFIKDPERRIMQNNQLCPICGAIKSHITLWCEICGFKITAVPRVGIRQKRCPECLRLLNIQNVKANWQKHKKKYSKKRRVKSIIPFAEIAKKTGSLRRLYWKMSIKLPEYPDTPILDKLILRRNQDGLPL